MSAYIVDHAMIHAVLTIDLGACTVVAQRDGDQITFEVRSRAEGAEPFTIAGPELQRLQRAWNTPTLQRTVEREPELAAENPPAPPPKLDALTRFIAWLREDVTGGANVLSDISTCETNLAARGTEDFGLIVTT